MFGDDNFEDLVEELLGLHSLSEILEFNDLTEAETLAILIRGGHIGEPAYVVEKFDSQSIED